MRAEGGLVLAAFLVGCTSGQLPVGRTGGEVLPQQGASQGPPPPPPALPPLQRSRELPPRAAALDSRLQPGVVLALRVTDELSLSRERAVIGPDGKLFVPLLGRFQAGGLTPLSCERAVRSPRHLVPEG